MEDMEIIRRSSSAWASPLHMVAKASGGWRPCGDYRCLNNATTPNWYPMPHIQDFTNNLAVTWIFSMVDLVRSYHQIPVHEPDIPKTAVITPFGLFKFTCMPFGLRNAAQAFQQLMDTACRSLDFILVYLDDILVASRSQHEHLAHLRQLFQCLQQHGFVLNFAKCQFGQTALDFLRHCVTRQGVIHLPAKVAAITKFLPPSSVKESRSSLACSNFTIASCRTSHSFCSHFIAPSSANLADFWWTADMSTTFVKSLANATMLTYLQPNTLLAVMVDASATAVGAVIEQLVNNVWQPLAFFSRQLRPLEQKYSAFDHELPALYLAICHFCHFVEGRNFTAFADHKPLTFTFAKVAQLWSATSSHCYLRIHYVHQTHRWKKQRCG